MSSTKLGADRKETPISNILARLNAAVGDLDQSTNSLHSAIDPCLRPDQLEVATDMLNKAEATGDSSLYETLRSVTRQVTDQVIFIRSLTARIEL